MGQPISGDRPSWPAGAFAAGLLLVSLGGTPLGAQLTVLSPAQQDAHLAAVAAEAARRGPATPVPLLGSGTRALGALYDRFHVGVLVGRALMAANQPPDPAAIAASPVWQSRGTVIVAYPIDCDGAPNQPLAIAVSASFGGPVGPTPIGNPVRGAAAQDLLPGVSLPADALVQSVRDVPPIGASVRIDYAGPACRGAAKSTTLELNVAPSKSLLTGLLGIKVPDHLASVGTPATVRMQVLLDVDGRVRFPHQVQGPIELGAAATALLEGRTFEPWTINGVAVPQWTIAPLVFTATGEPAQPEPFRPPPMSGGLVTIEGNPRVPARMPTPRAPVAPPPPGQSDTHLARLAIEVAQKGEATPIPLDPAGLPVHGLLFDRFLVGVVKARAAAAAGAPMDPAVAAPSLVRNDMLAVAFPLACPAGAVAPTDVQMSVGGMAPGAVLPRGPTLTGAALAERLPGLTLPDGAVGRAFANAPLAQNLEVRIHYADRACPGDSTTATLPIQWVRGAGMGRPTTMKLPPEAASLPSPTTVQIRGLVDREGRFRFPTLADGPAELEPAAQAAAATWRFQPYRANGVPMPQLVISQLTFTTTGMPEPMAPGRGSTGRGVPGPPAPIANTTVGGRSSVDITSPDVPGLNAATSKCAISDDDGYGYTPAGAIKVGGGSREGPARERRYLSVLRGPNGQGLRAFRLGSTMGPDGTILDMYQVTYAGLDQPLRLYLDEYHDETLKAPKGLVCAEPGIK